jgi:hypothetical protein
MSVIMDRLYLVGLIAAPLDRVLQFSVINGLHPGMQAHVSAIWKSIGSVLPNA